MNIDALKKVLLFIGTLMISTQACAWWNDQWPFRKDLSVDVTELAAQANTSEVPVLIRLHAGNFGYFQDVQANGEDIRFVTKDDKTPLSFHIEKYDPVLQMAFIWVKVPMTGGVADVTTGKTNVSFYMYYGNQTAVAGGNANNTYDVNQSTVWHFNDQGTPTDSTAYGNVPTLDTAKPLTASLIGAGVKFDGTGAIGGTFTPSQRIVPSAGWTWSAWIKLESPQENGTLLHVKDGEESLRLDIRGTSAVLSLNKETALPANLVPGVWNHVALVITSDRLSVLVNGAESSALLKASPEFTGTYSIGSTVDSKDFLLAEMDEVNWSNSARAATWLGFLAKTQAPGSTYLFYGEDASAESGGGGEPNYLLVTLQNLTHDALVVIVILGVMGLASVWVMGAKAMAASKAVGGNRKFLEYFEKIEDIDAFRHTVEKMEDHDSSPSFHIFRRAMLEVNKRVGHGVGSQAGTISAAGVSAIRYSLDGEIVRQNQKLNSLMVLLTIAISGGPFIGLLGTVIGVMITFAAIAAQGEVNVNAIAPGIAAALAATVAGLAVAIPALFGYNYIGSQLKNASADMQVFADELIGRIAERYEP